MFFRHDMTTRWHVILLVWLGAVLLCAGCGRQPKCVDNPQPSVYYWRTTFSLDDAERSFLAEHKIGKLYLHLFDVVRGQDGGLQPSATLLFQDSVPKDVEVIPVVFIAPGALRDTSGVSELPGLIVRRIDQMLEQNYVGAATEIQLDYDWVQSDQQTYFAMLQSVVNQLHASGRKLSVTIRLHQLSLPVPPADYGVLMVYNTGNLTKGDETNSILSVNAVGPYLRNLHDYDLPLCTALPVYSWDLLFHSGHFVQILKGVDVRDTACFAPIDSVHYRCLQYMPAPNNGVVDSESQRMFPGDVVRHEWADMATIRKVRSMLERERPGVCSQTIVYHLDNKSLNQYTTNEIQEFFTKP